MPLSTSSSLPTINQKKIRYIRISSIQQPDNQQDFLSLFIQVFITSLPFYCILNPKIIACKVSSGFKALAQALILIKPPRYIFVGCRRKYVSLEAAGEMIYGLTE
jgi:hypothetical protein